MHQLECLIAIIDRIILLLFFSLNFHFFCVQILLFSFLIFLQIHFSLCLLILLIFNVFQHKFLEHIDIDFSLVFNYLHGNRDRVSVVKISL